MRNLYTGSSSSQPSSQPSSMTLSQERSLNDTQTRTERYDKYTNASDKVDEYDTKLTNYSIEIEKLVNQATKHRNDLAAMAPDDPKRNDKLKFIAQIEILIAGKQAKEELYAAQTYNAIKEELDKIHSGSLGMSLNISRYRASKHNKDYLEKRLKAIREKFDPDILADRNKSLAKFNRNLDEYNKILKDLLQKEAQMNKMQNVPQSEKQKISDRIAKYRKDIADVSAEINNIKYYQSNIQLPTNSLQY